MKTNGAPQIIKVPLEWDSADMAAGDVVLSADFRNDVKCAMVGLLIAPFPALYGWEVLSFLHNDYEAVTTDEVSSVVYGPHLGALATCQRLDDRYRIDRLTLWPGDLRSPRLGLTDGISAIPVKGGRRVSIRVKKLFTGATAITHAYLVVVPMSRDVHDERTCDARLQVEAHPHWWVAKLDGAAGAGFNEPRAWNFQARDEYGLRVRQFMAAGYSDNSGWAYDATYKNATKVLVHGYGDEPLVDEYGDQFIPLPELAAPFLRDFQVERDPRVFVQNTEGLRLGVEREATTYTKRVLLTGYGTLHNLRGVA